MEDLDALLDNLSAKKEEKKKPSAIPTPKDNSEDKPKTPKKPAIPMVSKEDFDSKMKELYEVINILQQDVLSLSNSSQQPATSSGIRNISPNDLYFELLEQYELRSGITYAELKQLTTDQVDNPDHLTFLKRYKKNKSEIDLFYNLIKM